MVKGQDTGSGVNKVETTAGVRQQSGFTFSAADNFQHTRHVNKTANHVQNTYGTAPGNFAVGLLLNNVLLCQTSRASRQRHRWNQFVLLAPQQQHELESTVSTRIVHRHCLTPRVTDVWPRGWRLLAGGVDGAGG